MKIRILDRILVALAGLLMIAGVAALAAQLFFGRDVAGRVASWLNDDSLRVYIIIAGILICAIGIYCVLLLFRHRGRSGKFIMQRTESGELAISLNALESMVQKCLDQHKEVNAQSVSLDNQKGSLLILIRGTVAGGISIPLTVDSLQQQIKQYVTACSGVEIKDIRVEIESSGPDAKDAPFKIEAPAAKGLLKGAGEEPLPTETIKPEEKAETAAPEEKKETVEAETPAAENPQPEDELSAAAAAAARLMNQAPEEDDDRPMHQRLFSTVEEPCVMPMPPMNLDEAGKEENGEEEAKPSTQPSDPETPEEKKPEEPVSEEKKTEEKKPADETAEKETPETEENEGGVED